MSVGDSVSVFDARRDRWCRAQVVSIVRRTVTVAADSFLAVVPLVPAWVRPIRVIA